MLILGIDPGLASIGWAIVENSKKISLIDCGCFVTEKETNFAKRLEIIFQEIEKLAKKYQLGVMAVEELFFAKNVKTAINVAQCLGVIKLAGSRLGLEVIGYTPLNVKMTITGYGRADKKQIEFMVKQTLGIKQAIKPDHAADAVAVALAHCFTNKKLK